MEEEVLQEARFNTKVKGYWILSGCFILFSTVVGIPLIPFFLIFGAALTQRYLDHMSCVLTTRSLKIKKGIFVRTEKTVPLDKITDLGLVQGPIMRSLDIEALSVETAGQSGAGPLVSMVGIENGRAFRDIVLKQRDIVTSAAESPHPPSENQFAAAPGGADPVLHEIRDVLVRIEKKLDGDGGGK